MPFNSANPVSQQAPAQKGYNWKDAAPGIGGGIGSMLAGFFSKPGVNPADAANKELDKIPGQVSPYYDPYRQAGGSALEQLMKQYGQMTSNPNDFYNMLAGGYKESPGYQYRLNSALGAGNNASAAGGMLGTPAHQEQNMSIANDIAGQDFDKYFQNMMNIFGQGQQGYQGINQMGYNANSDMASLLAQVMSQKSQNQFQGQSAQNQFDASRNQNMWGGVGNLIGGVASLFGPVGGAAGGLINYLTSNKER